MHICMLINKVLLLEMIMYVFIKVQQFLLMREREPTYSQAIQVYNIISNPNAYVCATWSVRNAATFSPADQSEGHFSLLPYNHCTYLRSVLQYVLITNSDTEISHRKFFLRIVEEESGVSVMYIVFLSWKLHGLVEITIY